MPPTPPQSTGDIMRKVGALLAPDRLLLCAAVGFLLLAAAAELAIPHYVTAAVFAAAKVSWARQRAAAWHSCRAPWCPLLVWKAALQDCR